MIHTYDYDSSFEPSMPVVEIKIARSLTVPILTLQAMIDSGADGSIIPVRYLQQINARKENSLWIRTVTGKRSIADMYSVAMQFGPFEFRDLLVVGGSQEGEIIIGRDILNQFIITLNGLANVVEISQ